MRQNTETTKKSGKTHKFTAKDRADHDRLREQIKEKLREERRARYEIAVLLAEVKERELWRIGGRGSFGSWVQANFGIKKRQANKYVAVRLGLTQEQVEGSRLCLDMQALIAGGRPVLRGPLMALAEEPRADGKGTLPDGAIKAGLRTGEEALNSGQGDDRAVRAAQAAARSWQAAAPVGKGPVGKVEQFSVDLRGLGERLEKNPPKTDEERRALGAALLLLADQARRMGASLQEGAGRPPEPAVDCPPERVDRPAQKPERSVDCQAVLVREPETAPEPAVDCPVAETVAAAVVAAETATATVAEAVVAKAAAVAEEAVVSKAAAVAESATVAGAAPMAEDLSGQDSRRGHKSETGPDNDDGIEPGPSLQFPPEVMYFRPLFSFFHQGLTPGRQNMVQNVLVALVQGSHADHRITELHQAVRPFLYKGHPLKKHMARLAAALRVPGMDGRRFALYCLIAVHLPGLADQLVYLSEKDLPPGIAELVRYYRNLLLNLS